MKKCPLVPDDFNITSSLSASTYPLLTLFPNDSSRLTVQLVNRAMRFVHCDVFFIPQPESNQPQSVLVNYKLLASAPPSDFFRATNLLSGLDKMPAYLLFSKPSPASEELPLAIDPSQALNIPTSLQSRFEVECVGPSLYSFVQFRDSISTLGGALAWVVTIVDNVLFSIFELIGSVYQYVLIKEFIENIWIDLIQIAESLFSITYTASDYWTQLLDFVIGSFLKFLTQPTTKQFLVNSFGEADSIVNVALQGISKVLALLATTENFLHLVKDLKSSPARTTFTVDIPRRRQLIVRTQPLVLAQEGVRFELPIQVVMPNGDCITVAQPDSISGLEKPDGFVAGVRCWDCEQQMYEFLNIRELSNVHGEISIDVVPVTLLVRTGHYGTQGNPILSVRSSNISSTHPCPQDTQDQPVTYAFPEGLGRFVKGISSGQEEVVVRAELLQTDASYPHLTDIVAEVRSQVIVSPQEARLVWGAFPADIKTGTTLDVPLAVTYLGETLDLGAPFSARVSFAPSFSYIELTEIEQGTFQSETSSWDKIRISIEGVNNQGEPIASFAPSPSLALSAQMRRIYLPDGLSKLLFVKRVGTATLQACLQPIKSTEPECQYSPICATTQLATTKGEVVLKVYTSVDLSSEFAGSTDLFFEDDLFSEFIISVTLPTNDVPSFFATDDPIHAHFDMTRNTLRLSEISYDCSVYDPPLSPVDLICAINDPNVEFSPDDLLQASGAYLPFSATLVAPLKRFVKAAKSGKTSITVSCKVRPDYQAELQLSDDVTLNAVVAEPATLETTLSMFDTTSGAEEKLTLDGSSSIQLWLYDAVRIDGTVAHYSTHTTVTLYINNTFSKQIQCTIDEMNNGHFSEVIKADVVEQRIRIEAEKATNFGQPSTFEFTLVGVLPELDVHWSPDGSSTGKTLYEFTVAGKYCTVVKLEETLPDNSTTSSELCSLYGCPDGMLSQRTMQLDVQLGKTHVKVTAENAFGAAVPSEIDIIGREPRLEITSIDGKTANCNPVVTCGAIDVDHEDVAIIGYADTFTKERRPQITYTTPDSNALTVVPLSNGPFTVNMPAYYDGEYLITLSGSNEFHPSNLETKATAKATYSWNMQYEVFFKVVDANFDRVECGSDSYSKGISPDCNTGLILESHTTKEMVEGFEAEWWVRVWSWHDTLKKFVVSDHPILTDVSIDGTCVIKLGQTDIVKLAMILFAPTNTSTVTTSCNTKVTGFNCFKAAKIWMRAWLTGEPEPINFWLSVGLDDEVP